MSLRLPTGAASIELLRERGVNALADEIAGETASSLGHHGRMAEKALKALHGFAGPAEERAPLVRAAAREVWKYFIQRELCGLRDHRDVIRFYDIPQEVLVRLGAMDEPAKS